MTAAALSPALPTGATPSALQRIWLGHRQLSVASTVLLLTPFFVLMLVVFAYPLLSLLSLSVLEPHPTLSNYARVFENPVYLKVMLRTAWISLLTTVLALVLGFPLALMMTRVRGAVAVLLTACVLLPLWSSVLVRTAAWIVLLRREGIVNDVLQWLGIVGEPIKLLYTEGSVVLAMAHVLLPFMILPIYAALRNIPDDYMRAAAMLGASRRRAFFEVLLPMSRAGVWSGCLMVFLSALGFFVTPALVGSPQELMIATLVSQQVREMLDWPFAAALIGVLMAVVATLTMVFKKAVSFDRLMGGGA
ncbi:ABC transporter permease [Diaphorobacter aerolatus]|uniref:ABC transporter permease n=1 Tax=Diaphorobacter aerolatus TaxID=1288495 RepID=A0A7H0GMI1_9BURK|nr:ABC transporter permease [Diaphorobacter aerolatus]QNP49497.1 ABC transporter permease [Diaphorobacter aerolatus]